MELNPKPGRPSSRHILTEAEIEYAQKNTTSHAQASRFLGVSYEKYKRFAKMYNMWEKHLNQEGRRIPKKRKFTKTSLREILEGKHPTYDAYQLSLRLQELGILKQECDLCGFKGSRPNGRGPFLMIFRDDNRTNFLLSNLAMHCYNCIYLTTGTVTVSKRIDELAPEVYHRDVEEQLTTTDIEELQKEFLANQTPPP